MPEMTGNTPFILGNRTRSMKEQRPRRRQERGWRQRRRMSRAGRLPVQMASNQSANEQPPSGFIDTIQSLIVAFVLAMTFRGYVVEGFVIPTGSMAPTLLGEHWLAESTQTTTEVAVGLDDSSRGRPDPGRLEDHSLGRGQPLDARGVLKRRLGDRILVCKYIWPFFQPDRFDVAVFKNPTLPDGPSGIAPNTLSVFCHGCRGAKLL